MRGLLVVLAVAVMITLAVGCSKKTIYVAPGTKMEVEEKGKDEAKVTVKGKDGEEMTMETSKDKVTEAELGLPIYPGAEQTNSTNWSMSGKDGGGAISSVVLKTKDSYDKVAAFYKDKIKNPTMSMENKDDAGKRTSLMQVVLEKEKKHLMVSIKETDEGTEIVVQRMQEGG